MKCPAGSQYDLLTTGLLEPEHAEQLRTHAATCPTCRVRLQEAARQHAALVEAYEADLSATDGLTSRVLDAVAASSPPDRGRSWPVPVSPLWRVGRWAAALALLICGWWALNRGTPSPAPRWDADVIEHKMAEVRLALGLTQYQLHRVHQTVCQEVLSEQIGPTMRRLPIQWPVPSQPPQRSVGS